MFLFKASDPSHVSLVVNVFFTLFSCFHFVFIFNSSLAKKLFGTYFVIFQFYLFLSQLLGETIARENKTTKVRNI